jgi:hypothetical protein
MRVWVNASLTALFLTVTVLLQTVAAQADCASGGTPTYDDISDIAIQRCSGETIYRFLVGRDGYVHFDGRHGTPVSGSY